MSDGRSRCSGHTERWAPGRTCICDKHWDTADPPHSSCAQAHSGTKLQTSSQTLRGPKRQGGRAPECVSNAARACSVSRRRVVRETTEAHRLPPPLAARGGRMPAQGPFCLLFSTLRTPTSSRDSTHAVTSPSLPHSVPPSLLCKTTRRSQGQPQGGRPWAFGEAVTLQQTEPLAFLF